MAYTKLFQSIISSTIWTEDHQTRIVWITILAMADKNGEVQASIPGLARMAGTTIAETEKALAKLLAPDPYSRTKDEEGRRLEEIDGGWSVINHQKYRKMASKDDEREKSAERKRRQREREKSHGQSRLVTRAHERDTQERDIAEAEADKENPPKSPKGEEEEWDGIFPANCFRKSRTEQNKLKVLRNNEKMAFMGAWFGRRPDTLWTVYEAYALRELSPSKDEVKLMDQFRKLPNDYPRTSLSALLNNWHKDLDKARVAVSGETNKPPKIGRGY